MSSAAQRHSEMMSLLAASSVQNQTVQQQPVSDMQVLHMNTLEQSRTQHHQAGPAAIAASKHAPAHDDGIYEQELDNSDSGRSAMDCNVWKYASLYRYYNLRHNSNGLATSQKGADMVHGCTSGTATGGQACAGIVEVQCSAFELSEIQKVILQAFQLTTRNSLYSLESNMWLWCVCRYGPLSTWRYRVSGRRVPSGLFAFHSSTIRLSVVWIANAGDHRDSAHTDRQIQTGKCAVEWHRLSQAPFARGRELI
jgi:hypothetical protein